MPPDSPPRRPRSWSERRPVYVLLRDRLLVRPSELQGSLAATPFSRGDRLRGTLRPRSSALVCGRRLGVSVLLCPPPVFPGAVSSRVLVPGDFAELPFG